MMQLFDGYLRPVEAARLLGVSTQHVRWLIRKGRLREVVRTPLGRLLYGPAVEQLARERAAAPRGRGRPSGRRAAA